MASAAGATGATRTKTKPKVSLRDAATKYYAEIQNIGSEPRDTYSVAEFYVSMSTDGYKLTVWRGYPTRENIPKGKLGFSCSIVASADGVHHRVHMIWHGDTSRACPYYGEWKEVDERILQEANPDSYLPDDVTWRTWWEDFNDGSIERAEWDFPSDDHDVCVVMDGRTYSNSVAHICFSKWTKVVPGPRIEKSTTRSYLNPAEQLIISCLEEEIPRLWEQEIQTVQRDTTLNGHDRKVRLSGLREGKRRLYRCVRGALQKISPNDVLKAWHQSGIMKYVFKEPVRCHDWRPFVDRLDEPKTTANNVASSALIGTPTAGAVANATDAARNATGGGEELRRHGSVEYVKTVTTPTQRRFSPDEPPTRVASQVQVHPAAGTPTTGNNDGKDEVCRHGSVEYIKTVSKAELRRTSSDEPSASVQLRHLQSGAGNAEGKQPEQRKQREQQWAKFWNIKPKEPSPEEKEREEQEKAREKRKQQRAHRWDRFWTPRVAIQVKREREDSPLPVAPMRSNTE